MVNKAIRVQKIICAFFMMFFFFVNTLNVNSASYEPQKEITVTGKRTPLYKNGKIGGYATVTYYLKRTSYDSKANTAKYNVTSSYYLEDDTILYGDKLWINGIDVGNFDSNNGHRTETKTIWRKEIIEIILHSGRNTFKTTNIDGVGGDSTKNIPILNFATPPVVHGTNGVWYEGEVASGKRTWESLYTDGKTGSKEGNKVQTSTGFMYSDIDEQKTPVNAYSNTVLGRNSVIDKIIDQNGKRLPAYSIAAMNSPGVYTVYSSTKDSSGFKSTGSRKITVKENKPPTITAEDRWFYIDENVTNSKLLERVKAKDIEDGDITKKVTIQTNNVKQKVGVYEVTYKVIDSVGKSATTKAKIHIVDNGDVSNNQMKYLRFINAKYLNTLKPTSKWRIGELNTLLVNSLRKGDGEGVINIKLTNEDVNSIKRFNQTHDYSKASDDAFYTQFKRLWKEGG